MFENIFKSLDDVLRKEAGCTTELDYTEQASWLLFLKYLDDMEQERAVEAAKKVNGTNAPVEFVVHNGGHVYPNDAPNRIVAFFKQQARK